MRIIGDRDFLNGYNEESAASTFTQETIDIVNNIVAGNAILITKIIFKPAPGVDVPAAGNAWEWSRIQITRDSKTALVNMSDDDLIANAQHRIQGNATDVIVSESESPYWDFTVPIAGIRKTKGGLVYPYKYMYIGVQTSNAAAAGGSEWYVEYFPVELSNQELLEITQEHIIND